MKIIFSPLSLSCGCYQIPSQLKHKCLIKQPGRSWEIRRITQDWEWHFPDSPHYSYRKHMKTERRNCIILEVKRLKIIRLATAWLQITVSHGTSANQTFLESDKILPVFGHYVWRIFFIVNHFTVRKNKNLPWVNPQSHKTKLTWVMKFSFTLS